jgi:hypothetical protein
MMDEKKKCPICGHDMIQTDWTYHPIEEDEPWGGECGLYACGFCHLVERVISPKVFRVGFDALKGKVFTKIEGLKKGSEEAVFHCSDGTVYYMFHHQECCENVWLEDVCGETDDLVGSEILVAEENSSKNSTPAGIGKAPAHRRSFTWTFYKLATRKGYVVLRWFGESNGYYSEKVLLNHVLDPEEPAFVWYD